MKNIFENIWDEIDRRLYTPQVDTFLSDVEDLDCPCPVCSLSEDEKNDAEKQIEKWIEKWA